MKTIYKLLTINLQLFDNTNVTTDAALSIGMKTFYSDYMNDNVQAKLIHDQLAQKLPIPANGGKTVEFRQYTPYPKALTALTEGVTPTGRKLAMTKKEATVQQYGDYTELSDVLILTALDNNIMHATKLHGVQAGETLDTITREVLNGGTSVQYAEGQVAARNLLTAAHKLTVAAIKRGVRFLKNQKAPTIDGYYVALVHPDTVFDLQNDPAWVEASKYGAPEQLFTGEIGRIAGCRFLESTEAKIFAGAGAGAISVYSTIMLGDDAYGVTEITGGGLKHIVKQLGSAGAADALDQRATVGWKALKTAIRLVEPFILRIETGCTFSGAAN